MKRITLLLPIVLGGATCLAQTPPPDAPKPEGQIPPKVFALPYEFNGQLTYISQNLAPFHSPYSGRLR
jgi:hypothetical protein